MGGRKKILIIGEAMVDKTISVSEPKYNNRSCITHKITKSPEPTFGGVFFISRYLQHFEDVEITVLNICPTLTSKIKPCWDVFFDRFPTFPENGILSKCKTLNGSCDFIHSITRFMANGDQEIYFQIEDYYAPNCRKNNGKIYSYSTAKRRQLSIDIEKEIDNWFLDNNNCDKRILLMDYDLGLFEKESGVLSELEDCINKKNDSPVIIYSGKDYTKFKSFKNAHIVTYSKNDEGDFIEPNYFLENIKNQSYCFRSLVLVSAKNTSVSVFSSTKKKNVEEQPISIKTDASVCNHGSQKHVPRTGHKAIIAAHLAMALTNDNSLLNESWLEKAHDYSKIITRKLLTENFVNKGWRENEKKRDDNNTSNPVR